MIVKAWVSCVHEERNDVISLLDGQVPGNSSVAGIWEAASVVAQAIAESSLF